MNILVVGGSGYIGTIVCKELTKFAKVINLDNQIYNVGYDKFLSNSNYVEFRHDIRNLNYTNLFDNIDVLIVLAGLVGDPITKKYPKESIEINEKSIMNMLSESFCKNISKTIFVSTCSNYGRLEKNQIANEETILKPLSLYAKSKVKIENFFINSFNSSRSITILRFATAFGLSPRMRYDLTVNQFVREAYFKKYLEVYDPETNRPYCHVNDFSQIINLIVKEKEIKKIQNQVFNAGGDVNNCSKLNLVKKIKKYIPAFEYNFVKNDVDKRDYIVSFEKINKVLGFQPQYRIEDGIEEILNFIKIGNHEFKKDEENYGNYTLLK